MQRRFYSNDLNFVKQKNDFIPCYHCVKRCCILLERKSTPFEKPEFVRSIVGYDRSSARPPIYSG